MNLLSLQKTVQGTALLMLISVGLLLSETSVNAQCFSNPTGPGTIAGNAAPQNVSITTNPTSLSSSVTWSNGATGSNIVFTPSCSSPGNKTLTPCFLAGTTIPTQSFNVPNFNGVAPASFNFSVSGICYGPGANFSGVLPINIGGSGNVLITLTLPDGSVLQPPALPISTVNSLSPIDISLFGLQGNPNGNWTISIGGDATTYNIGAATFFINSYTLTETFCGPPVQFTVTPCPAPCPVFQSVVAPLQACAGADTQLGVQFNVPAVFNASYQWTGPNGFSSTAAQPIVNPVNNTCDPINVTYSVSVWCTNDNSVLATNQPVTFTVYPTIDPSQISIDNTSNILDPGCAVSVNVPCNFAINGVPSSLNQTFTPGDNGTSAQFIISNGLPACNYVVDVPITCIGSCVPATVDITTQCIIGNTGYTITLSVSDMGDSQQLIAVPSQGVQAVINNVGSYILGPFTNNQYINIKLLNPLNPSCNINLGNFTKGCKPCPTINNVTSNFQSNSAACEGDIINLTANVTGGIAGVDYYIKWQVNGEDIPGGVGNSYSYVLTAPGCEVNEEQFTAVMVCLTNGQPPVQGQVSTSIIKVYPVLTFNVDFFRSSTSCVIAPVASPECAGNVVFTTTPTNNLTPGSTSVLVNYSAKVIGAPNSCQTTGRYTVSCPDCIDTAGEGTPLYQSVCWGESFSVENTGSLATSPGYKVRWNVTNAANGVVLNTYGPLGNPGNFSPNTFVNNGSFLPAGGMYCFTPSLVFDGSDLNSGLPGIQNSLSAGQNNVFLSTLSATLGPCSVSPNCTCILGIPLFTDLDCYTITPGIYSASHTFSGIPYCEGISSFNINITVTDNIGDLFNPFSQGSISSDFPAPINEQHNDGSWTLFNYTGDPNGKSVNIVAIYLNPIPDVANPAQLSWTITITPFNNPAYPLVCNSCHDVGEPACVELLPQVQLATIPTPAPICEGDEVNLTLLTPTSNLPGTFFWYDGNPATNGILVGNPGAVVPTNGQTFYVLFREINDESCDATRTVTFTVVPRPTLNTPPPLPPVCPGESIDLTILNSSITTAPGTLQWFISDPDVDGALLATPNNVIPIGSERYYALFTDAVTGCTNKLFVQATYHPLPLLLSVLPVICPGEQVDLALLQPGLIGDAGVFHWFNAGGTELFPNGLGQILVTPVNGTTYTVSFTSITTGCTGNTTVTYGVDPLPTLFQPTASPVCEGEEVNLTTLEAQITGGVAGVITWYLGNPTSGGVLLDGGTVATNPATQTPSSADAYFVNFVAAATGCQNTINFTYPFAASPTLITPLPSNNFVCSTAAPVNLIALQPLISNNSTFEWYKGDPDDGGILLDADGIPIANDNPASQPIPAGTTVVYYAILTNTLTGCVDTISISYTAYLPVSGATASYDCNLGVVVSLSGATGGSGSGYAVSPSSPQQTGSFVPYLGTWTIVVTDNFGCTQTLTGISNCPTCEAGGATPLANNRVCCGESIHITNTTAVFDLPQDFVIGWAITPQATGPVTDANGVFAANDAGLVFQGNEDYSLDFEYGCLGLPDDLSSGIYYATPFISERPPEIGPPPPIVYSPADGCLPDGQICPLITGTGWVINPMIITFPDGTFLNVNDELAFGAPIDETLLAIVGGSLPCLSLASLYPGDPNGIWTISITNTGTGSLGFSAPDFNVVVPANGCSLLTQDQVNFVAGVDGLIAPGQTLNIDINVPSAQVVIPTLTYDPANGCIPEGEFCPEITGTGWAIDELVITFPDGTFLNINDAAGGLTITEALLGALGGNLPCLALDSLFQGDPNGLWTIYIHNIGPGTVFFNIPDFDVVTDAAICTLISQDEIVTIPGTAGAVAANSSLTLEIQVPPIPSLFPAISETCNDYGTPVQVVLLDEIAYESVSAVCVNNAANLYLVSVSGVTGGAPQWVPGSSYVFPAAANLIGNTYTFQTTINSFPYTFQIANSVASAGGSNCGVNATIAVDPCICIPPVVGFATQCVNNNQFSVIVNIAQTGSSGTYNITDNQGTFPVTGINTTGTYVYGTYNNGTQVNVTLVSVTDALCNVSSGLLSDVCTPCSAGTAFLPNGIVCCDDVATIVPQNYFVNSGNIIAWAVSISPLTGPDDLVFASSVVPGVGNDFTLDFSNPNCQLPAGFYYATPFIAQAPGEIPQPDPIVYNPALGCNPVGEICPLISGTGWVINPLIISFPDGSSINVAQQLIGANVPITPDLLATIGGNLPCIPLSTLYNGNPNGTWTISITNTGTGAVSFSIPSFNVTVDAASCALISQDQVTTIGGVAGSVLAGSSGQINIVIPNPNTEIPDFPTFDPNCQDFGVSLPITVVDPITFNTVAACNDGNNDGDFDEILVTVSSITGGSPAIFPASQYVLPTGFTQISSGVYQISLPLSLGQTDYQVSVGSSQGGQSNACETLQTITLPFCPVGCLEPTVLFGAFCDSANEGQFLVSVNITDFGFGNASYSIANSTNGNVTTVSAIGIYQIGPFNAGTPVTVSVTGVTRPECVVNSVALDQTCLSCTAGEAVIAGTNVACCGETLSVDAENYTIEDGTIIAWALADNPLTNPAQLSQALSVTPGNADNGYEFTNDCSLTPGTYFLTPFIAQTPGEAPQPPPVVYNPALGCNPVGEICPVIGGTGWAINPILIHFPDGSTVNVVEQFLGVNLTVTPDLLAGIGGLPCIPLDVLYSGDPNGEWIISVNNIGTGTVEFSLPSFSFTVDAATCPLITEDQVTTVGTVSGNIVGGTLGSFSIQVPNPNTEIPDFPTFNPACQDFGDAVEIIVAEPISFNFAITCNDPDGDGVSSGYVASITNLAGGSPAVVSGVNYLLPAGYTQIQPGVYQSILPSNTSGTVTVSVGSTDNGCATSQTQSLPACFFTCQPPIAGFLTECNEDGTYFVNVNLVNFGAGNPSYTITNSVSAQTVTVSSTGITQIGPFGAGVVVNILVTGTVDAACSVSGTPATPDCTNCTVGTTNPIAENVVCCGGSVTVSLTDANVATGNVIAWALNDSPITDATDLEGVTNVWPASPNGSYTFDNDCDLDPGVYYFTPFIAEDPGFAPPPDPIIYDPAIGCNPVGAICPIITGTGWIIDPLLITFPDGSTINVLQELAGLSIPITPSLLAALGGLPCIPLSTLYAGDPNGTWTISVNNTGTGPVSFEIPEFDVTVSADGCPLITEDQITTIGAVSGTVQGGQLGLLDIVIPNPNEIIIVTPEPDPIVYDPALGCNPVGEICPIITGTGWIIDPLLISFPDGSTINVLQELAGLSIPITPALLGALGGLPCLPLSTLYDGDPNGVWTISVNNIGTGPVSFEIPEFNVTVSADACPLITEDQVTVIGAVSGTVVGGSVGLIDIVIPNPLPPVETDFPTVDPNCSEFGQAVEVIIVQDIDFSLSIVCHDADGNGVDDDYLVTISNLSGGTPEVVGSDSYVLPAGFTETTPGVYTLSLPLSSSGVYDAVVGSTSGNCEQTKAEIFPSCITTCQSPTATFATDCVGGDTDNFYVIANITSLGLGNSSYTVSNNQNANTQIVSALGVVQIGPFANNTSVIVTLTGNNDATCGLSSNALSASCGDCFVGTALVGGAGGSNVLCCGETLSVTLSNAVLENGNVIAWALSTTPVTNSADLTNATAIYPANATNGIDLTNDCSLTAGTYFLTPFTADAVNFPAVNPDCEYYGTAIQVVLVDEISYDFTITCYDPDGNGVSDGYLATISNLAGGAPAVLPTANYVLPAAYTETTAGVYTQILPNTTTGNQTVVVSSSVLGLTSNCAVQASAALPNNCNFTCTPANVTFTTNCIDDNTFEVLVTVNDLGSGLSHTLTDNTGTAPISITSVGTYSYGVYNNNTNVLLILADNNDSECIVLSGTQTNNCAPPVCTSPEVTFSTTCFDDIAFQVVVNIVALGSGNSYTISDNQGSVTQTVTATGSYVIGLYANNTVVQVSVADADDASCTVTSGNLSADCAPICIPPTLTYAIDCINTNLFAITVNIVGDSPSGYIITDDQGTSALNVDASGSYSYGNYPSGSSVNITVSEQLNETCGTSTGTIIGDCSVGCIPPVVEFSLVCIDANSFEVEINITALGSSETYTIVDNLGAVSSITISATGTYNFGPYSNNTAVIVTVVSDDNTICNISSAELSTDCTDEQLPPVIPNDIVITIPAGGQGVTFNIFDYVTDPNGDPMTLVDMEIPVTGGTLTFNADGTVTFTPTPGFTGQIEIEFTVTDGNFTVTGTLIIDILTDIPVVNIPNFALLGISPVPAKDWVKIDFTSSQGGLVGMELYDITGRLVIKQTLTTTVGSNITILNIAPYPVGVYVLVLNNGQQLVTGKVVKD